MTRIMLGIGAALALLAVGLVAYGLGQRHERPEPETLWVQWPPGYGEHVHPGPWECRASPGGLSCTRE